MLLRRNEISFLFQNFGLMESRTIRQNLLIGLQYSHLSTKEKNTRMLQALEQTGLDKPLNTHAYNLSGGEQQRVALARVLLKPSSLVLADEPTGSLDSRNRDFVMNRISALKDCVKTVIVVSHDDKFREISDNVIFLHRARIRPQANDNRQVFSNIRASWWILHPIYGILFVTGVGSPASRADGTECERQQKGPVIGLRGSSAFTIITIS